MYKKTKVWILWWTFSFTFACIKKETNTCKRMFWPFVSNFYRPSRISFMGMNLRFKEYFLKLQPTFIRYNIPSLTFIPPHLNSIQNQPLQANSRPFISLEFFPLISFCSLLSPLRIIESAVSRARARGGGAFIYTDLRAHVSLYPC